MRIPFIKNVSKGDAKKLIKWWNRQNGDKFFYYMERDGRFWNIYRQSV